MSSGCAIATPTLAYAWVEKKDEFDALALTPTVHHWMRADTLTLIKNDGREWERRVHSKTLNGNGICVVFQWHEERHIEMPNDSLSRQGGADEA